jgi:hypothetical protein
MRAEKEIELYDSNELLKIDTLNFFHKVKFYTNVLFIFLKINNKLNESFHFLE